MIQPNAIINRLIGNAVFYNEKKSGTDGKVPQTNAGFYLIGSLISRDLSECNQKTGCCKWKNIEKISHKGSTLETIPPSVTVFFSPSQWSKPQLYEQPLTLSSFLLLFPPYLL